MVSIAAMYKLLGRGIWVGVGVSRPICTKHCVDSIRMVSVIETVRLSRKIAIVHVLLPLQLGSCLLLYMPGCVDHVQYSKL